MPFDIIESGLYMRFKRDGDAYKYDCITHKLKKVFNDRNIPKSERSAIPVLCDNDGILWVPGLKPRDLDRSIISSDKKIHVILSIREKVDGERDIFTALQR